MEAGTRKVSPEDEYIESKVSRLRAYHRLFASDDGKIVLNDLMKMCYVNRTTVGGCPEETYMNEGQRQVILRIMETLKLDIGEYKEHLKHQMKNGNEGDSHAYFNSLY